MNNPGREKYAGITDERLMTNVHHGDTAAFNELYSRYNKRLLYYFYRMLGNSDEKAKDFLQDIFIKIIERPELFDASRRFSTWIFSVAHNMCKNEYRRMSVRNSVVFDDDQSSASVENDEEVKDNRLTADLIFNTIESLGEMEKTAFILYYREDFSLQEIGKVLSLPEGTVKSRLFYTRKKLSRMLNLQESK